MSEGWSLHGKDVVSAFDLSEFQLIYDLGGSSGGLAKELISVYPNCTIKLFDLPGVVEISKKSNAFSDESQISFHEGDFLKDPIPEADLYILSRVMFNWSDEKCIQLLTKVFTACKPGGGVLAVDPVIDDKISELLPAHLYCMIMLVICEGKSRKNQNIECFSKLLALKTFKDCFKDPFPEADLYILSKVLATVQLPGVTMNSPEEAENIKMFFHHQHSFVTSKIIFTASELGVFDLLRESGEPLPSATVAERLKTSLTGMQMLLEACVGLKVLKVEWKEGKGLYGNTEFADLFLAKSSPKSQYYSMKYYSEAIYPAMQHMSEAVSSKEGVESFFNFMSEGWSLYGKEVVSAFDLSEFQLIYDLGGSSGGLAKELISVYPNCTVKLFNLPGVVEISKKYNAFSDESQISFHEGGGVLAMDPIIDDKISESLPAHLYCMIMLVICEGKSRKESEHRMLFQTAGFKDIQFKKGNVYDFKEEVNSGKISICTFELIFLTTDTDTMSSAEETENIKTLFHYQYSFVISKIIFSASQLGVFDLLRESGELLSSVTVAEHLNTSLIGMQTLLRACVGLKVLKVEWKDGKDLYGNTEFADLFLAKSSPKSQYYSMKFCSEFTYSSLQHLPEIVRSNEGAESLFRYTNESWTLYGKEIVSSFDLSGFQLIYCLDGNNVGLAKELISKYPNCTVKLCDLPEIVEKSKKYSSFSDDSRISFHEGDICFESALTESYFNKRIILFTGDCFKDPIPEADLYILSKVMYNWSDEKCIQLLTKLFMACKPGGGVLVVEPTVDEEISGSLPANLYCILMLLYSEGKTRKASEHHTLFNTAGFKDIQFKKGNVFDKIIFSGGVLIVEPRLDKDKTPSFPIAMYSIIRLLVTEGKMRTPSEYCSFLSTAGFKDIQLKKGNIYDVILGRK
ncbi:hypothetical protein E2320_004712 [Naja naja]|nr:hypothetical protein E2320_004712 [Naja naja]